MGVKVHFYLHLPLRCLSKIKVKEIKKYDVDLSGTIPFPHLCRYCAKKATRPR